VTASNVTFEWPLEYDDVDLGDTLTCNQTTFEAGANDTTRYLNGNLDLEGNCTLDDLALSSATVQLCSSNEVFLGVYDVLTCDPNIVDNTTIILAEKTLICNPDLAVNSLPLYIAAVALGVVVTSVTLFLYYKYTRIQIPEEEAQYQEALMQQAQENKNLRRLMETGGDDEGQDVEYLEEDMVVIPYGEVASSTKVPASQKGPTTSTSADIELAPFPSQSEGHGEVTKAEPPAHSQTKTVPKPTAQPQPAATPEPKKVVKVVATLRDASPKPRSARAVSDENVELVSSSGQYAILRWWKGCQIPSEYFPIILKVNHWVQFVPRCVVARLTGLFHH